MLLGYRIIIYLALPFFLLRLLFKAISNPLYRQNFLSRFGFYFNQSIEPNGIIVHAVSVGEVNAASGLIKALQNKYPRLPITVTCMTPTGSARIKALFGESVQHVYLPYDFIGSMRRFIRFIQPQMLIVMETEVWPNLLIQCEKKNIKVVFSNVRLSKRSYAGYKRFSALTNKIFRCVKLFLVQSRQDAEHVIGLGANEANVHVCGNVKFDSGVNEKAIQLKNVTRRVLNNRPVFIAASTREGEEQKVLAAYQKIKSQLPDVFLVLVPRHPERGDAVSELIKQAGYQYTRFSQHSELANLNEQSCDMPVIGKESDILLVDAIGHLAQYYAAADVAFVGGSLVDTGCQNVLEPCAYDVPVLFGPSVYNFAQITALLLKHNGAIQVEDSMMLAQQVCKVLQDTSLANTLRQNAASVIENNAGALERQLQYIYALLDSKTAD